MGNPPWTAQDADSQDSAGANIYKTSNIRIDGVPQPLEAPLQGPFKVVSTKGNSHGLEIGWIARSHLAVKSETCTDRDADEGTKTRRHTKGRTRNTGSIENRFSSESASVSVLLTSTRYVTFSKKGSLF